VDRSIMAWQKILQALTPRRRCHTALAGYVTKNEGIGRNGISSGQAIYKAGFR
jgi:hypothetical protein